jgi:phage N-6-adenine-methyltransferase
VLEAKSIAEAALHYAKVTNAANDTHADCLRIIMRAEMRMADEIDRGQEAGEVARKNQPVTQYVQEPDIPTPTPATYEDLGIDRRRVADWREIRDAGPEKVEEAIQTALDEGRAPTKADIKNHVRGTFGTGENEWYTPTEHIELARSALGKIDLDPASSETAQETVKATNYFTEADDGLKQIWEGNVWLNPPYAQPAISQFADKMVAELSAGRITQAIMLTHNYTDTAWFQKLARAATAICFTRGRVKFVSPSGDVAAPTQGQAFFYFGAEAEKFIHAFRHTGFCVEVRT